LELTGRVADAMAVLNATPPKGKEIVEEAVEAVRTFGIAVCEAHVGHRASFVAPIAKGKGITEASPKDAGAKEIRDLFDRIIALAKRKARKRGS
jgi:hypothetical protein